MKIMRDMLKKRGVRSSSIVYYVFLCDKINFKGFFSQRFFPKTDSKLDFYTKTTS